MADWKEINVGAHKMPLQIGEFGVKGLRSNFKIFELQGRKCMWFVDSRNKVCKLEFNKNYKLVAKATIGIPLFVKKYFKENEAIIYRDENAIYLSPYALGQEHLEKFLASEKVLVRR
jgi:hypothetical protein